MKLVVDGQRNLTVLNIHKFALAMGLDEKEHDFLVAIVHFNQEHDQACQEFYQSKMVSLLREHKHVLASDSDEKRARSSG